MKRLLSKLIFVSETQTAVLGTLLISAGINLVTGLDIITSTNSTGFYDVLRATLAIPSVLIGIVLFMFIDINKGWAIEHANFQKLLKRQRVKVGDEQVCKRNYENDVMPVVDQYRKYLVICLWAYIIPALLITRKITKEWTMVKKTLASLALAALAFVGCGKTPPAKPITLGYQQTALYRHLFVAKEKGFFDQEGIVVNLQNVPSGNGMLEGLVSGQLDGAGLINLQVGLTVQGKDPNRFRFINFQVWGDKSFPDYILARSQSNIKTIKDLEGRTVGLHPGSAVKAFSRVVLQHFNVNVDKVKFIELEPSMMQSAVLTGRVDAVYALDPAATTLLQTGQCTVLVANPMQFIFPAPVPISGSALSLKFLTERPEDAQKVSRALEKAILYLRELNHEDEIAGYIAKYTPITKDIALKVNPSEYWTQGEIDRARVQALADRFYELKIVEKKIDVGGLLPPSSGSVADAGKQ
jgi:NitT/TauT family transport system substrate-binding protein